MPQNSINANDEPQARSSWLGTERAAWLCVVLWAGLIFAVVPLARAIQRLVRDGVGNAAFGYVVIACVVLATGLALRHVSRSGDGRAGGSRQRSRSSLLWLIGVSAVFIVYTTQLWHNAEEAMHFVQYGVLSLLLLRALSFRMADASAYVVAVLLGTLVGQLDECFQWLVPERYFGLRDVWIDFVACALTQTGVAMGLRPAFLSRSFDVAGGRAILRAAAANVAVLFLCSLNTPVRVERYADAVPALAFLAGNPSTMFEFGTLYEEAEFSFKSRLRPEELARADRELGAEAGAILRAYPEADYAAFLVAYPPGRAPFVHEARVHLFRRDRMLVEAAAARGVADRALWYESFATQALREELILTRYFASTLTHAGAQLSRETIDELAAAQDAEAEYLSSVSLNLITRLQPWQLSGGLAVAWLGLVFAGRRWRGSAAA